MTQGWRQSKDGQRWRRPLSDGTHAVASKLSDQTYAVSVNSRFVLRGYASLPEVMADFDSFHSPLQEPFDYARALTKRKYKRRPRRESVSELAGSKEPSACTASDGHYFLLPRPQKGTGGACCGTCKHCGAERRMSNVEKWSTWQS